MIGNQKIENIIEDKCSTISTKKAHCGDIFRVPDEDRFDYWMLARVSFEKILLISLLDGNRIEEENLYCNDDSTVDLNVVLEYISRHWEVPVDSIYKLDVNKIVLE